jgi:hypothetical protein
MFSAYLRLEINRRHISPLEYVRIVHPMFQTSRCIRFVNEPENSQKLMFHQISEKIRTAARVYESI